MSDALSRHAEPHQREPARRGQVRNSAGGYVFAAGDETRLNRFLTIGTEGGTFYVRERELTRQNVQVVEKLAAARDPRLVDVAVAVSQAGRAPRNNPALFALAAAAGSGVKESKSDGTDPASLYRAAALAKLPQVARTGSHIMQWVRYAELYRGWGPQLVKAVRAWFDAMPADDAAYQVLKYKQREGWSQRDLIRLAHVQHSGTPEHQALWEYVAKGTVGDCLPLLVHDAAAAHRVLAPVLGQAPSTKMQVDAWVRLIFGNRSLSWEMLPSEALAHADVWRALAENGNLPPGALIRNLGRMTVNGAIKPMDAFTNHLAARIADEEKLARARIHPVNVLIAMKTYARGHGQRGKGSWTPVPKVVDALDAAFYSAFGNVEPSGKRTMIALDVSGSMGSPAFSSGHKALYESTGLVPCEITAAMSMMTARTEQASMVTAFSHRMVPLAVSPRQRLDDVVRTVSSVSMGGTDCSLPMIWAMQNNVPVDVFQVWTDNETWYGNVHPHRALEQYRQHMGIDARMQVCAAVATEFLIADPLDTRQLDVSGFDAAVPKLLADHARGSL